MDSPVYWTFATECVVLSTHALYIKTGDQDPIQDTFSMKKWVLSKAQWQIQGKKNPLHSVEPQCVLYTVESGAMFKLDLSS